MPVTMKSLEMVLLLPEGRRVVKPEEVVAQLMDPYPVVVLKTDNPTQFRRYVNVAIEYLDEPEDIIRPFANSRLVT